MTSCSVFTDSMVSETASFDSSFNDECLGDDAFISDSDFSNEEYDDVDGGDTIDEGNTIEEEVYELAVS